ncbi:MAG: hypothetical protein C4519_27425 [Desulfobacteraceae bacterium]|nr:MAG: hypothetical protein C4519_27425 [Desulfobacteraceae bacterium]
MTSSDEQIIREWALQQTEPAKILLARGQGAADERLTAFCDRFKALAPATQIRNAPDESFRSPALIIGRHANVAYQAVPEGKELPPFLDALKAAAVPAAAATHSPAAATRIDLPAELTLYIAMQCPFCPQAVRQLSVLAESGPRLRVVIVDGVLFDTEAKAHGIRSAPTLILDNHLRWVGRIDWREVMDQMARRDPSRLSPASLRQMLEAGEAARAAGLMIEHDQIFPALFDLLVHERWSVRLGAMVTVEYLADQAPHLAGQLFAPLWERFGALAEPVQGDIVHVFGQIGSESAPEYLRRIASGRFAEPVRQAAAEELDEN